MSGLNGCEAHPSADPHAPNPGTVLARYEPGREAAGAIAGALRFREADRFSVGAFAGGLRSTRRANCCSRASARARWAVTSRSARASSVVAHGDMTAEHLSAPARQQEEVFGALGLLKEPQPFLVAGTGTLALRPSQDCPIVWPFVGVSNRHVVGYSGTPDWVLSIENLTTFHQASQHPDAAAGLILYTGGMPSPSWCRAYASVLDSLSESTPVYHWGDIDQGGFRIAAHIRARCIRRHPFHPWLMDATRLDGSTYSEATEAVRTGMARHARNAGWETLSQHMSSRTLEQEGIAIHLPTGNI